MDQTKAPPAGCSVLVTLLDGTTMEARCRGVDGEDLLLLTRDGRPDDEVTVVVRWDHAGEAYEAAGLVVSDAASDAAWRVRFTQGPDNARCRRHPRVPVRLPVRITSRDSDDEVVAEGVAVDLSSGGMRVSLTRPSTLSRGDEVAVVLAGDGTVLRCVARVAHTAEDRDDSVVSEYGIVFCQLAPGASEVVTALVEAALSAHLVNP